MTDQPCLKCKDRTLPDPALDRLTLVTCSMCGARFIRKHFWVQGQEVVAEWVRLKWWQRF